MEAERLKTTSGLVSMSNGQTEGLDPATANLATVIRTAMTRLASEIQRTTNHYRAQMSGSAPSRHTCAAAERPCPTPRNSWKTNWAFRFPSSTPCTT